MKEFRQVLIFSTVWPEPSSSAAGVRQLQWIRYFLSRGAQVTLSSPGKMKGEQDWGALRLPAEVKLLPAPLNDSRFADAIKALAPDLVMFDRFLLEEQFGHLIYQHAPNALTVMETQDLHFVRRARAEVKETYLDFQEPRDFYHTETALRETASIERADFSFLVSAYEERLLREEFGIGTDRVKWVPFWYQPAAESPQPAAESQTPSRTGFVWIGNFRHAPNVDGLRWFRSKIWPLIRRELPQAQCKIYGAYPSEEVMQWNSKQDGIQVKGSASSLDEVFTTAQVNLAPLRFGAGVKGKILEGFRYGVPCVTTKVGAEGIEPFPGLVENDEAGFARACIELDQNQELRERLSREAVQLMKTVHSEEQIFPALDQVFEGLWAAKAQGKLPRWSSRMMRFELMNSHKYFSKWIEEKEKHQK